MLYHTHTHTHTHTHAHTNWYGTGLVVDLQVAVDGVAILLLTGSFLPTESEKKGVIMVALEKKQQNWRIAHTDIIATISPWH